MSVMVASGPGITDLRNCALESMIKCKRSVMLNLNEQVSDHEAT